VQQFEEDNQDPTLESFLATASLSSDLDDMKREHASLMTLHAAKGLVVVSFGRVRAGLLPHSRTLNDPAGEEAVRALPAQERLYLTHARERRLWGSRTRYLFPVSNRNT